MGCNRPTANLDGTKGGFKGVGCDMTLKQVSALIEWLKEKGLSADEILECIQTIAEKSTEKPKSEGKSRNGKAKTE